MRRLIYALSSLIVLILATGCGGGGAGSEDTRQVPPQGSPSASVERATLEDPSLPGISQILGDYDDIPRVYWFFNEGGVQIPPDNFFSQRAREEIGIAFIPINPEPADFEEILFEMLAAGQQIDIIMTWRDLQNRLVAEGLIQPVCKWLNESYLPNLVRVSRIWDDALMESLRLDDGYIYAIPSVLNSVRPETLDWIRADWLEYLNLEIPTTYDELTAVLRAFIALDPAEDEDDHVRFFPFMVSGLWSFGYIFQAYGADMHWYIADDGYLELGILSPRLITVLELLSTWHNEGLINPDFMYTFSAEVMNAMMDSLVGYHRGWLSFYDAKIMAEFSPGANWIPIQPLRSPYFDRGYSDYIRPTVFTRNQYSIHRDSDIHDIFRLINWMNEDTATSTDYMTFEGAYWYQFGERGVHWDVIDGQFVGPGGPDTWQDLEKQAAAIRFALAYERDRWVGGAIRRFLNVFDTRWMGDDPFDMALIQWEQEHIIDAGLMATDIPLDSPHLARTIISLPDDDGLHDFLATFTNWSDWGLFAETIVYPAISGQGNIRTLFDQWLEMANEAGYQEFRRLVTAHVGIDLEAEEETDYDG